MGVVVLKEMRGTAEKHETQLGHCTHRLLGPQEQRTKTWAAKTPELYCHRSPEASGGKAGVGRALLPQGRELWAPWLVAEALQPLPLTPPGPPSSHLCACASVSSHRSRWMESPWPQCDPISKDGPTLKIQVDVNHWGTCSTSTGAAEPAAGWPATLSLEGSLQELRGPGLLISRGRPRNCGLGKALGFSEPRFPG